jgi:hypothetical protein
MPPQIVIGQNVYSVGSGKAFSEAKSAPFTAKLFSISIG